MRAWWRKPSSSTWARCATRSRGAGHDAPHWAGLIDNSAEACDMIDRSLNRAAELIGSFKQVAVDRTAEHRRGFDLASAVEEMVSVQRAVHKHSGCTIHVDIPPGLWLESYPGPLGQVLDILVDNANRHGFDNQGGDVRIEAEAPTSQRVVLRVIDNGRGIAAEHLDKVFDPFFTTQLGRGGSGLGLHIAWNIVEGVLGGEISVRTLALGGTSFELVLPVQAP